MKTLIVTLMFAAAAFSQEQQQPTQTTQPQQQRSKKQGEARRASMKKLQADLDQAASRAKFTDEQRKQFEEARQAMKQQGGRRKRGAASSESANAAGSPREAMRTLRSLTSSEAFQAEDRELLRKDFDELRKSGRNNRQGGKTRKSAA